MIWDCYLYNGESSLQKIRVKEFEHLLPLKKTMEVRHVAIESNFTFTGIEKPFRMTLQEIEEYGIEWFPLNDKPFDDPWKNEARQRNFIKTALISLGVQDDDIVIISDCDEIVRAYAVQHYRPEYGLVALQMDIYYFFLNTIADHEQWRIPKIMTWDYLKSRTPEEVRRSGYNLALVSAGWHYGYAGGINTVLEKFKSFAHQDKAVQQFAKQELLEGKIERAESLWGDNKMDIVPDSAMPYYVQTHMDEFKHMIYDPGIQR